MAGFCTKFGHECDFFERQIIIKIFFWSAFEVFIIFASGTRCKKRLPVGGQSSEILGSEKRPQKGTFSTLLAFVPWLNDLGSKFCFLGRNTPVYFNTSNKFSELRRTISNGTLKKWPWKIHFIYYIFYFIKNNLLLIFHLTRRDPNGPVRTIWLSPRKKLPKPYFYKKHQTDH